MPYSQPYLRSGGEYLLWLDLPLLGVPPNFFILGILDTPIVIHNTTRITMSIHDSKILSTWPLVRGPFQLHANH